MAKIRRSKQLFERALRCIPGGVNSPVRSFKHVGGNPIYFSYAEGPYLHDVDGKSFIDLCMGFGPHLFGHSPPVVVRALQEQAGRGTSFGACHEKEVELASRILSGYPFLDRVRLVNSGTEAVMTAIRVARGYTERSKVIKFDGCYHGHSDSLLAKSGSGLAHLTESSSKGIPKSLVSDTLIARLDSLETVKRFFEEYPHEIAAVILEPVPANAGLWIPERDCLKTLIEIAHRHGALVIFDEVITGFRLGQSGCCGLFDLKPDLVTLGKVIGGGLPLAAVAGSASIMEILAPQGEVYQAGTLSGNVLATSAGLAVMERVFSEAPYSRLETLSKAFVNELESILRRVLDVELRSIGSIFWFDFDCNSAAFPPVLSLRAQSLYRDFFHFSLEVGVYLPPSPYEVCFLSTAHTREVLDWVLDKLSRWKR